MRENSPFIPGGGEPGMLGEIATTRKPSAPERDMESTTRGGSYLGLRHRQAWGRKTKRWDGLRSDETRPSTRKIQGWDKGASGGLAKGTKRRWRGRMERKGRGGMPAGVIRSDTERRQTAERRMFRRSALTVVTTRSLPSCDSPTINQAARSYPASAQITRTGRVTQSHRDGCLSTHGLRRCSVRPVAPVGGVPRRRRQHHPPRPVSLARPAYGGVGPAPGVASAAWTIVHCRRGRGRSEITRCCRRYVRAPCRGNSPPGGNHPRMATCRLREAGHPRDQARHRQSPPRHEIHFHRHTRHPRRHRDSEAWYGILVRLAAVLCGP